MKLRRNLLVIILGVVLAGIASCTAAVGFLAVTVSVYTPIWAQANPNCNSLAPDSGTDPDLSTLASFKTTASITTASQSSSSLNMKVYGSAPEFKYPDQRKNAIAIDNVSISRGLDVKMRALVLAVAIQESNLHNLNGGDRDSVGLFQQRPSAGWGRPDQLTDPVYATNKFIDALLRVTSKSQRASWSLIELAIKVQIPNKAAYHSRWKWDALAYSMVGSSKGSSYANGDLPQSVSPGTVQCTDESGTSTNIEAALKFALSKVGARYVLGDGNAKNNTFDCSELTQLAFKAAGVTLPRVAQAQYVATKKFAVNRSELRKGDLLFFDTIPSNGIPVDHVGIYWGDDKMLHAPNPRKFVGIYDLGGNDGYYWPKLVGASRPIQVIKVVQGEASVDGWGSPLKKQYAITSPFAANRVNPATGVLKIHDGTDYGAPSGATIIAVANGTVESAGPGGGYGNYVTISHAGGKVITGYAHMSKISVHANQKVTRGQVIGYVGSTGNVTGAHLHFNVRVKGYDGPCGNGHCDWVNANKFINNTGGLRDSLLNKKTNFELAA